MPSHRTVSVLTVALLLPFAGAASGSEWRVDPAASRLTFIATQAGKPFEGWFDGFSAFIRFDQSDLPASKALVVNMASARTGNAQGDAAIKGQDWLAVATYPNAQFETKAFRHVGGNRYEAEGVLSIRDVAKPVIVPFALTKADGTTRAAGDLVIDRTDFGVGQGQWASPQLVAHEVTIRFDLLAKPGQ